MKQAVLYLMIAAGLIVSSCTTRVPKLDYSDPICWWGGMPEVDSSKADVFYILPTCVFDWIDADSVVHHHSSVVDTVHRSRMEASYQLAHDIFASDANFFAPYYRQITMNVWMDGDDAVDEHFPLSMKDVKEAFDYYEENLSDGRPLVLAGFSQGGKCVVELLKMLSPSQRERLVAAYVCGYKVTKEDLEDCPAIRPAKSSDDTGVTIVYNSVAEEYADSAISPVISGSPSDSSDINRLLINMQWTTDTLWHSINDTLQQRCCPEMGVLLVRGADSRGSYVPSIASLIPLGNLHLQELTLYGDIIRENVSKRIAAYRSKRLVNSLCTGDLLFVGTRVGDSAGDMSDAIVSATGENIAGAVNYTHVAIVESSPDGLWVVDATPRCGVSRHALDSFFVYADDEVVSAMRLRDTSGVSGFVAAAKTYEGQAYDFAFSPDNQAQYCSELVYNSYVRDGVHLFEAKAMNFRSPDGSMPAYWEELFAKLKMPIPQGVPGTNPQDMSKSKTLFYLGQITF